MIRGLVDGIPGVRSLARAVWRLPDQVLHPIRRRRALRVLASVGPVRKIVVLCLGNINRSAYAAALLRARLAGGAEPPKVLSAGFIGPDRPSPPEAVAIAAIRGVDLTRHRSRLVTREMLSGADLVLVMCRAQRHAVLNDHQYPHRARVIVLGDLDPASIDRREIPDPYDQVRAVYESSFDRIERCLDSLLGALSRRAMGESRAESPRSAKQLDAEA